MPLSADLRRRLSLPAICAPMTMVSGPELVTAACKAGLMAALPVHNASSADEFEAWLTSIRADLARHADAHPESPPGPLAVNLSSRKSGAELAADLSLCARHGVEIFISAAGDPTERTKLVHDQGGLLLHDVTTLAHAEKAISAGVDGLTCVCAGGGGHSGVLSPLVFVPRIRQIFDGVIVMAGGVTDGAAIRAAEALGADLAYIGTRFIATQEARAPLAYKQMLVSEGSDDLLYTPRMTGVSANWLLASLRSKGLDPGDLPLPSGRRNHDHLPDGVRPWHTVWSAGQGIDLINDIPSVSDLVRRLQQEYVVACEKRGFADITRLSDPAGAAA